MERPKNKYEYREQLAQMFIDTLNEHGLNWKKEWHGVGTGCPVNGVTKAKYRGCNMLFLHMVSMMRGYKDPRWVTMIQIMDQKNIYHPNQKWHLKKGTKAVYVEYWYMYDMTNRKSLSWSEYRNEITQGRKEDEFRLSTRYTAVFNADAVDGMPELPRYENASVEQEELVSKLSENMGVPIYFDGGNQAFYRPSEDAIHVPEARCFESSYAYNSTVLHELAHSTGHSSRLNRNIANVFGSESYAFEELIAEMTSCFMSVGFIGEEKDSRIHLDNHKAYIQSWTQSIKEKPEMLLKAIKEAQTAAAFVDYKAELIDEAEYTSIVSNMKVQKAKEPEDSMAENVFIPAKEAGRRSIRQHIEQLKEEVKVNESAEYVVKKLRM